MTILEHPESGTVIDGKYRLDKPIGIGGMGAVYFATQIDLGRKVAIKLLHPNFHQNSDVIERFHREAKLAASIGHDNICEVTDFGTTEDGAPYLVMPVLKGCAYSEVLKKESMPLERVCDIMGQVLSALDAAHIAGVVHRDLKPDNIFISKVGDRKDFVKLLDFGISKVLESSAMKELTRTGTVMGTPVYMAPEQARGEKNVDHRLDIYAAGVILYESLTGSRPHDGDSYNEIVFKIITESFPPPRELNPDIPKKLEKIVIKAMAKEPSERYASAKEMAVALRNVAETTLSPSITNAAQNANIVKPVSPKNGGTRRFLIPVFILLLLIIIAGVVTFAFFKKTAKTPMYTALAATAAPPPAPEETRPHGKRAGDPKVQIPIPQPSDNENALPDSVEDGMKSDTAEHGHSEKSEAIPLNGKITSSHKAAPPQAKASGRAPPADIEKSVEQKTSKAAAPVDALPEASTATKEPSLPEDDAKPVVTSPPPIVDSPESKRYTNMTDLKSALNRGEITRAQYSTHQDTIRTQRTNDIEKARQAFSAGKLNESQYEQLVGQIKRKYEDGTPVTVAIPTGASPAPVTPAPHSFDNMQALKTAFRNGRITREQYRTAQAEIRKKRAAEYDRIKAEYRADKISRDQYEQQIEAARRKFEGN